MAVIDHPRDVLTLEAMKGEPGWDAALNLPFPTARTFICSRRLANMSSAISIG